MVHFLKDTIQGKPLAWYQEEAKVWLSSWRGISDPIWVTAHPQGCIQAHLIKYPMRELWQVPEQDTEVKYTWGFQCDRPARLSDFISPSTDDLSWVLFAKLLMLR